MVSFIKVDLLGWSYGCLGGGENVTVAGTSSLLCQIGLKCIFRLYAE